METVTDTATAAAGMNCLIWPILLAGAVLLLASLLRWFEQTAEAVEERRWDRVLILLAMPLAVWRYPSKFAAGRPMPVPRHEPVRGMGTAPKFRPSAESLVPVESEVSQPHASLPQPVLPADEPPPGTPKEFLGMPVIPPKPKASRRSIDPEQVAKLRQKMREQGMLPDDEEDGS